MAYIIYGDDSSLRNIPCDVETTLYGDVPREHATREEAEDAMTILESSGDWPDGTPEYWIEIEEERQCLTAASRIPGRQH